MRILIVDDAPALRTVLTRILVSLGHEVTGHAVDEPAALALAARTRPDAIAIDGRLAGADVVALLGKLRSAVPEASLLVVASLAETALVRAARDAGAAAVVARPFLPSRIAATLHELAQRLRSPEREARSPERE